jgi:hypothetical protein
VFHAWGELLEFRHGFQLGAGGLGENRHEWRRFESSGGQIRMFRNDALRSVWSAWQFASCLPGMPRRQVGRRGRERWEGL